MFLYEVYLGIRINYFPFIIYKVYLILICFFKSLISNINL